MKTGTGKSRWAFEMAKTCESYYYKTKGKWWDLYENEKCVIWDDFRGSDYEFNELLKLCDRYPYKIHMQV